MWQYITNILNHVLHVRAGEANVRWLSELQPLSTKDAATISAGLAAPVTEILSVCLEAVRSRKDRKTWHFIHLMTGDAIPTNDAAARRVLPYIARIVEQAGAVYFLVVCVCASHQANLTTRVAVCGPNNRDEDGGDIAKACSRLYRHLMADYAEEFALGLRVHVQGEVKLIPTGEKFEADVEATRRLQELYGNAVLPEDLLELHNQSVSKRH